jgi:hypothetical protein
VECVRDTHDFLRLLLEHAHPLQLRNRNNHVKHVIVVRRDIFSNT